MVMFGMCWQVLAAAAAAAVVVVQSIQSVVVAG